MTPEGATPDIWRAPRCKECKRVISKQERHMKGKRACIHLHVSKQEWLDIKKVQDAVGFGSISATARALIKRSLYHVQ